jgi:hypothetical protein
MLVCAVKRSTWVNGATAGVELQQRKLVEKLISKAIQQYVDGNCVTKDTLLRLARRFLVGKSERVQVASDRRFLDAGSCFGAGVCQRWKPAA